MLLAELVATSRSVRQTRSRTRKLELLAEQLRRMGDAEVRVGASYLAGEPRQERLDVGWAAVAAADVPPAREPTLTLDAVDTILSAVASASGAGARTSRQERLVELFLAATEQEQEFLRALLLGDLRQGALRGIVAQAIARAWDVPEEHVRRALLLHPDIGAVAQAAQAGGVDALRAFRLTLLRPVEPMLAQSAASVGEALGEWGRAFVEHKLDGARVQVHRDGDRVAVYTRNLRDVTARLAGVVAVARALPVTAVVLDGEAIGLGSDARPLAFQDSMRGFGGDDDERRLVPFFFDCLHVDGDDLLDVPLSERAAVLAEVVPDAARVPRRLVNAQEAAEQIFADAVRAGHEGVMVKSVDGRYEAGRRGAAWRKVKQVHTLDLVVLAAEWGSGRRRGWLSNVHLGARDPANGGFVMLGKTFKGMTDEMLAWQTQRLLELEVARDGHIVHVRPELVVEVAFDGVQTSPRYPGGVALRFARIKRYREDKTASQADTIDAVRRLHGAAVADR